MSADRSMTVCGTGPPPSYGGMETKGCVTQDPDRIPKDPPRGSTPCRPGGKSGTKKGTVSFAVEDDGPCLKHILRSSTAHEGSFP